MTTELQAANEQQASPKTPWVFVDKHENLITNGGGDDGGILFVYPSMVPEAYDEFFRDCGGYVNTDDYDAIEKLHEAVQKFVDEWEQERAAKREAEGGTA